MICSYLVPTSDGTSRRNYGTLVRVFIPGLGTTQVVYQFGTPTQRCAVVHYQSGRIIAPIEDRHIGPPQERAAAACREYFENLDPERISRVISEAPVINPLPRAHHV